MTPRALRFEPHDGCAAMADHCGVPNDCDGTGESDMPTVIARPGASFELKPGETVVLNPGCKVIGWGSSTLLVLDAETVEAINRAR